MRSRFVSTITDLATNDRSIILITGDLGFSAFETFSERFPNQFRNAGIAEQNMVGVAAGLALSGLRPIVYSITPFLTLRALEQVRNDLCFHHLPVTLVGIGGGYAYGPQGATHHALEDEGVMRLMPNMSVFVPSDPMETEACVRFCVSGPGPSYIRLSRNGEPDLYDHLPDVTLPQVRCAGNELTIVTHGPILSLVEQVTAHLRHRISIQVLCVPMLAPFNKARVFKLIPDHQPIVVIEEHLKNGGLGTVLLEELADARRRNPVLRLGITDFQLLSGSREHLLKNAGLDLETIARNIELFFSNAS